jgi:hypothetical protein
MPKVSVPKPSNNAGLGLKAKPGIAFYETSDILTMPERDENGVLMSGNIVLKPNAYAITVYATQDTIELDSNSEGDTDNEGFKPSVKFKHPGNKQEIREFKSATLGKSLIAVVDYCDGNPKDLIGDICNPVTMKVNYKAGKDANGNEFTFQQISKGLDIAMYGGTIALAEPKAVVPAGDAEIALVGEGEYQLTGDDTSAAITTVTGASHGLVFTLLGAPTATAPAIAASTTFILRNGATWNGTAGAQITFKAYKSGASAYVYIEQSRA